MNLTDTRESNFLPTFAHLAILATLLGALCGSDVAIAQTPFQLQTGLCGGCSTCLQFGVSSATPVRQSGACNSQTNCGFTPSRFADLTSHRGVLQVVSSSTDFSSCPQNLHGTAQWNASGSPASTDVFFTGPAGQTSVLTRVRYIMSNVSTGDASLQFAARLQSPWANETPMPVNVTNFELVSPWTEVGLNFWRTHDAWIKSIVLNGSTCCILHLPLNEPVFELPPGYTANCPTLGIVDNIWHGLDIEGDWNAATGAVSCFSSLHLIHSVAGDLTVENSDSTTIDLGNLGSVGGSVGVSGNPSVTTVGFGSVTGVGESVTVTGNDSATEVDFGSATGIGGSVTVTGNGTDEARTDGVPTLSVNFASLSIVDGNLNISGNAPDTTVTLGPLSMLNGDLTLETKVTGALDLSTAAVTGDIDIKTRDAESILIRTPGPGGSTAISNKRAESSITATLPADTFSRSEVLTVERIEAAATPVLSALNIENQPIRISPMVAYHFDVAMDPVLQQDATLVLEANVNGLSSGMQAALLAAIADNRIMLASRGDASEDVYQALATCDDQTPPSPGGCAAMELLDADHNPLPPGSLDPIAFVRFTAVTDHFSDYAIAIEIEPGDVTADGVVDVDDLIAVILSWGPCGKPCPPTCVADASPYPAGNCQVDVDDLIAVILNWG